MPDSPESETVGQVLGTDSSTPLEWWVAVGEDSYLQLGDVVQVRTDVPGVGEVRISGIVDLVRAMHEGSKFESDVFLSNEGVLPTQVARSAHIVTTRVEPEYWVPPQPGDTVRRVRGEDREEALYFDDMDKKVVAGETRDGQPAYLDFEFLDGTRGAHINISGISGVATKTSYATFLLYSLFESGTLGRSAANTKAVVFNVKGEDLLFLDRPNAKLEDEEKERYENLGLEPGPFDSAGFWAPARKGKGNVTPQTGSRTKGVKGYYWTIRELIRDKLLRYLFVESGDERSQIADLVARLESTLDKYAEDDPSDPATVKLPDENGKMTSVRDLEHLTKIIEHRLVVAEDAEWTGRMAHGTITAFLRRLDSARFHCGQLIRGAGAPNPEEHRIDWRDAQLSVIDIHSLHDRAQRFVVGTTITRLFREKEKTGQREPLVFVTLDELNKYAPSDGWSPIKEVLLDIAERGRSLGVILIGAQQTASEVENRVVSNSAIRVVGRLDPAEASRREYGWLTETARKRSALLKPGHMMVQQPNLPLPLEIQFPFPSWATRKDEVVSGGDGAGPEGSGEDEDIFARFDDG